MAAYLIDPHTVRMDYDARLEQAIQYACDNQIHIHLYPAGTVIPKSCRRYVEKLDITTFGNPQRWLVQDELEIHF